MRHRYMIRARGLFALLLLAIPPPARAQLVDCSGAATNGGFYQLFLDPLSFARPGLENDLLLGQLMQRLSFKLGTNVETLSLAETSEVQLNIAYCENRQPNSVGQYNPSLIEALDDQDVVLELWGILDAEEVNNEVSNRRASVWFVLVPILQEDYAGLSKAGFQIAHYPKSESPGTAELIDLLGQSADLEAFTKIGIGVNLLRNDRYEEALDYLCQAKVLLEISDSDADARRRAALLGYVQRKARDTVTAARGDAGYDGSLKDEDLVDADNPCPDSN